MRATSAAIPFGSTLQKGSICRLFPSFSCQEGLDQVLGLRPKVLDPFVGNAVDRFSIGILLSHPHVPLDHARERPTSPELQVRQSRSRQVPCVSGKPGEMRHPGRFSSWKRPPIWLAAPPGKPRSTPRSRAGGFRSLRTELRASAAGPDTSAATPCAVGSCSRTARRPRWPT